MKKMEEKQEDTFVLPAFGAESQEMPFESAKDLKEEKEYEIED